MLSKHAAGTLTSLNIVVNSRGCGGHQLTSRSKAQRECAKTTGHFAFCPSGRGLFGKTAMGSQVEQPRLVVELGGGLAIGRARVPAQRRVSIGPRW